MQCTWYAGDFETATSPNDYKPFGSFDAALDYAITFGPPDTALPDLVWGSLSAFWNSDGSADYVEIEYIPGHIQPGWRWAISLAGGTIFSGTGFATAQLALADMQASGHAPNGFCTVSMNCDPTSLMDAAKCYRCIPRGSLREVMIYLLCQWAKASGCTLPAAPADLSATAGDNAVMLSWPLGIGATGYNVKRSLVSGGPYTIIGTSGPSPYIDTTAVNGTTYYYVVSSTNSCGESSGNSPESHAKPQALFSYAPATAIITWTDTNGAGQSGNLAFFNAHADFASVTAIDVSAKNLTSLSGLANLPALQILFCYFNTLTTLDVSGCTMLQQLLCSNNTLTTLDVSSNTALQILYCYANLLTVLDLTGNPALTTLLSYNNPIVSLDFTHNLALSTAYVTLSGSSLDLTNNTALSALYTAGSGLTNLDISNNPILFYLNCGGSYLTVNAVNTILSTLVSHGQTGGTVITSGQNPAAPPSVGPPNGIAAKAALLAEVPAWTVTTD